MLTRKQSATKGKKKILRKPPDLIFEKYDSNLHLWCITTHAGTWCSLNLQPEFSSAVHSDVMLIRVCDGRR